MPSNKKISEDARFSKVFRDSKFKNLPKRKSKVKIDKRFHRMFTDDGFQVKYSVDKRGRQISKSTREDLNKFYHISSSDESDSNVELEEQVEDHPKYSKKIPKTGKHSDNIPSLTQEEEDIIRKKQISKAVRTKLKDMNVDYARGEGKLFSESSSDESESEESEPEVYHEWNELDKDVESTENATRRLAVCNMDWDKVRALDLMALFQSFLPIGGNIHSIAIYPSEFGLQRLAEEEVKGPAEIVNAENNSELESDGDDDEEGNQYRMERMREYQLNRLKYYYAVATFDSPETADEIYNACNGFEYCKSGILMDLRFIDDDMTFEHEPKDICDSNINLLKYKPLEFTNTALQQTKVELTWDETDPRREELTRNITEAAKKGDINDSDLEDLVALSSSEEEEDDDVMEELKKNSTPEEFAPLQELFEKKQALKRKKEERQSQNQSSHDFNIENDADNTKKRKKSTKLSDETDDKQNGELELLLLDENDEDNRPRSNFKRGKRKFKKNENEPQTDDFEVDVNDDRFSALYSSHLFNIDPTDSSYRKTKGMQAFVLEKHNRLLKAENSSLSQHEVPNSDKNIELSRLVKSIKNKTKSLLEKSVKSKKNKS